MAAAAKRSEKSGISWINSGVDGEVKTGTSFKVASSSTGIYNKKDTKTRIKQDCNSKALDTKKTRRKNQVHLQSDQSECYYQEEMCDRRASVSSISTDSFIPFSQVLSDNSKAKSDICLKDLCPEDKRRIANLIEELARVTEEKEESMQRLKDEQGSSERKIQQLEEQNLTIAQERESLHQQYKECQELLALYQQYLLLQQAKLNQSIPQLSQPEAHGKVLSSEETHSRTSTSRANGSLFDGSYIGFAATEAQQSQVYRNNDGGRGAVHTFQGPTSLCCVGDLSPNCEPFKQRVLRKRECREPHLCRRCEHSQNSVLGAGYETEQQRSDHHQWNGNHYIHNKEEIEREHILGTNAKEARATLSQLSHEDWEEKKHQLLLQKMQLEMERERIQAQLAEQEERLKRQNEQLRQSRLDYSSFQQATQAELSKSNTREGSSEPGGPSQELLPPSASEDAGTLPAGQAGREKHLQTVSSLQNHNNSFKQSRRDMATSPAKPPTGLTSVSAAEKTPEARLDLSAVQLLDIFSPVLAPEPYKPATRRHKTSQRKPSIAPKSLNHTLLTPGGSYPQSSQQDLEESQILEDIFFIF